MVYRDGVSDGQMDVVANHESVQFMNTFRMADQSSSSDMSTSTTSSADLRKKIRSIMPENYNPQFVYIVVQKRISTR